MEYESNGTYFGSDEPSLTSRRNGLSLHRKIKAVVDNCWIAIVPDGSIDDTPTEWKAVLLNSAIKDDVFYADITDRRRWA